MSRTARFFGFAALTLALLAFGSPGLGSVASAEPPLLAAWQGDQIVLGQPIEFEIDDDEIRPRSMPLIRAIRDRLMERPEVRIEIQAHTDPAWVCEHCGRRLTRDRAASVRAALIHLGVPAERLLARGYRGERPLQDCRRVRGPRRRRACQVRNRRVELHVIPPASANPQP